MIQKTWFSSDFHYNHKNIVKGVAEWEDKSRCRDFTTLQEHNDALVTRINEVVGKDDILYSLGDWSFGGFPVIREFRERIKCQTIHHILGNHDHHIETDREGIRSLFASVQHYKEISISEQKIVLCHYGMRVWNNSHKGSWMLYGHSHGTLDEYIGNPTWIGDRYFIKNYRTMDVGVDTNNLYPYSFTQLKEIMSKRDVTLTVDQHGRKP